MLIMTRNMLASDGEIVAGAASLIFSDFSKLSSNLSAWLELAATACARFLAATLRSSSSSSFKSISIPFEQKASGTFQKPWDGHKLVKNPRVHVHLPSSSESFPLISSSSSDGASFSSTSNPSKNFSDGINRKTFCL
jgi:hypothetical protein